MCKSRLMLRVVPARSRNQWLFLVRALYLVLRNVTLFNFASPVMASMDYAALCILFPYEQSISLTAISILWTQGPSIVVVA